MGKLEWSSFRLHFEPTSQGIEKVVKSGQVAWHSTDVWDGLGGVSICLEFHTAVKVQAL